MAVAQLAVARERWVPPCFLNAGTLHTEWSAFAITSRQIVELPLQPYLVHCTCVRIPAKLAAIRDSSGHRITRSAQLHPLELDGRAQI